MRWTAIFRGASQTPSCLRTVIFCRPWKRFRAGRTQGRSQCRCGHCSKCHMGYRIRKYGHPLGRRQLTSPPISPCAQRHWQRREVSRCAQSLNRAYAWHWRRTRARRVSVCRIGASQGEGSVENTLRGRGQTLSKPRMAVEDLDRSRANILVYAHRDDTEWHECAALAMTGLAQGRKPWAIRWPSVDEFLAIVTHTRIYDPPSTIRRATDQVEAWLGSPSAVLVGDAVDHWRSVKHMLVQGKIRGPMVHDAQVAAICLPDDIYEFWTSAWDFSRFPRLVTRNPLLA